MYAIIEIHSGMAVAKDGDPLLFDTETEAAGYAVDHFGPDAGKEYVVQKVDAR